MTSSLQSRYGKNYLASSIVRVVPGTTTLFDVAGVPVNVTVPAQGDGVRVVVISDPCFSGRWVGCQYGLQWDTYNRTAKMLNALAEKGDVDMFAVLGDNLYVRPDDS